MKYGRNPFSLFVAEGDSGGSGLHSYCLGIGPLPFEYADGSIDANVPCPWFGIPWNVSDKIKERCFDIGVWQHEEVDISPEKSEEALKEFIELATEAAAALPSEIREGITTDMLNDLKIGQDCFRPTATIIWWMLYLWWQYDREFYTSRGMRCSIDNDKVLCWIDPFMASVAAIDRGQLLTSDPTKAEFVLREFNEADKVAEFRDQHMKSLKQSKWFNSPPDTDSPYKHGPIHGTLKQLAAWIGQDQRTLREHNGIGAHYIQRIHGKKCGVWCKVESAFNDLTKKSQKQPANNGELSCAK